MRYIYSAVYTMLFQYVILKVVEEIFYVLVACI